MSQSERDYPGTARKGLYSHRNAPSRVRARFAERGLPKEKPEGIPEREWWMLQRHVVDGWTYDLIAHEYGRGANQSRVRQIVARAAKWFEENPDA